MADTDISTPRYGRKKLDAAAYAAQQEAATREGREATRFGPRKIGTEKVAPESKASSPPAAPSSREPTGTLPSIAKLKALLAKSPAQLDAALEVELKQETPRKGALQLFQEVEEGKGDDARADVLAKIGAALDSFAD